MAFREGRRSHPGKPPVHWSIDASTVKPIEDAIALGGVDPDRETQRNNVFRHLGIEGKRAEGLKQCQVVRPAPRTNRLKVRGFEQHARKLADSIKPHRITRLVFLEQPVPPIRRRRSQIRVSAALQHGYSQLPPSLRRRSEGCPIQSEIAGRNQNSAIRNAEELTRAI